jgi:hypothetical protein
MALIQSRTATTTTATATVAQTFASNVTAGNLLIALVDTDSTGAVSGVAGGGTWALAQAQVWNFTQHSTEIWYCANATGGATTVTATVTVNGDNTLIIAEYSGVITASPLDKAASAQSGDGVNSSPADSGNTAATTQASELLIGAVACFSSSSQTATNGFTQETSSTNTTAGLLLTLNDKTVAATGAQKVTATISATNQWAALIGTFKLTAAGDTQEWLTRSFWKPKSDPHVGY